MVVHTTSTDSNTAYLRSSTSSPKPSYQGSNNNMSVQIQNMKNYFALVDSMPEAVERFKDEYAKVMHPDVTFEYPGGELSYNGALAAFTAVLHKGGSADLVDIYDNGDGTASMTLNIHHPNGENMLSHRIVHFKDGKAVRVYATDSDADQFGIMMKKFISFANKELADKYASMIACFDGTPNAYDNAEPIINEIVDRNVVIDHGVEGAFRDFEGFKEWAKTFGKKQYVAMLEGEVKIDEDGKMTVLIRNIVDGVDQGPVKQVGLIKNGKIIHWSAATSTGEELGFDKLVSSVAAQEEGMAGNIQRLRNYLAALDGSSDAWEKFEPHIDRVLARDVTFENEDGSKLNYDEIVSMFRTKYIPNGCYATLESVEENEDGYSLTVVINNHLPGEDGDATRQILYYGDDDLLHRLISAPFYEICERVDALPNK